MKILFIGAGKMGFPIVSSGLKIKKQKDTKNFSNPTIATAKKLTQTKKKTLI